MPRHHHGGRRSPNKSLNFGKKLSRITNTSTNCNANNGYMFQDNHAHNQHYGQVRKQPDMFDEFIPDWCPCVTNENARRVLFTASIVFIFIGTLLLSLLPPQTTDANGTCPPGCFSHPCHFGNFGNTFSCTCNNGGCANSVPPSQSSPNDSSGYQAQLAFGLIFLLGGILSLFVTYKFYRYASIQKQRGVTSLQNHHGIYPQNYEVINPIVTTAHPVEVEHSSVEVSYKSNVEGGDMGLYKIDGQSQRYDSPNHNTSLQQLVVVSPLHTPSAPPLSTTLTTTNNNNNSYGGERNVSKSASLYYASQQQQQQFTSQQQTSPYFITNNSNANNAQTPLSSGAAVYYNNSSQTQMNTSIITPQNDSQKVLPPPLPSSPPPSAPPLFLSTLPLTQPIQNNLQNTTTQQAPQNTQIIPPLDPTKFKPQHTNQFISSSVQYNNMSPNMHKLVLQKPEILPVPVPRDGSIVWFDNNSSSVVSSEQGTNNTTSNNNNNNSNNNVDNTTNNKSENDNNNNNINKNTTNNIASNNDNNNTPSWPHGPQYSSNITPHTPESVTLRHCEPNTPSFTSSHLEEVRLRRTGNMDDMTGTVLYTHIPETAAEIYQHTKDAKILPVVELKSVGEQDLPTPHSISHAELPPILLRKVTDLNLPVREDEHAHISPRSEEGNV